MKRRKTWGYVAGEGKFENRGQEPWGPKQAPKKFYLLQLEGKRTLGRTRCRWEDNIKIIFTNREVGAWTGSSWLRIGTDDGHL